MDLLYQAGQSALEPDPQTRFGLLATAALSWLAVDLILRGRLSRPEWIADHLAHACSQPACATPFTFTRRRHHCRACGRVFCDACTLQRVPMPALGYGAVPQRVCSACYSLALML